MQHTKLHGQNADRLRAFHYLGVESERLHIDLGFTATNMNRAGLREVLAA